MHSLKENIVQSSTLTLGLEVLRVFLNHTWLFDDLIFNSQQATYYLYTNIPGECLCELQDFNRNTNLSIPLNHAMSKSIHTESHFESDMRKREMKSQGNGFIYLFIYFWKKTKASVLLLCCHSGNGFQCSGRETL